VNYEPLYTFAEKHRVPYNELCTALREALAAPQPEPEKRIVWCTETDSACSTCPTLRIPCQAATQAAALNARVTVPREPTQEMIAAGEAVFRSYCFRHVNGAIPTYEAMIAAAPAPAAAPIDGFGGNLDEAFDRTASHCEGRYVSVPAPAVREPQDERIRWRDAVIKEAESALRTAEQELSEMPAWANMGHAAKKVMHALAVIAALGIGGGGK
jgi:hypothetical protein